MSERNRGILNEIDSARGTYAVVFFLMFVLIVVFLAATDTLPEVPSAREQVRNIFTQSANAPAENTEPEAPVRIVAGAVGLDVTVSNPSSTAIPALDEALLEGAIRYPTSAFLGQDGTVLLFGHSSNIPIVRNKNYKAFNGIQNLKKGSVINVYSGDNEYRYSVTGVRLANAEEDVVELRSDGKYLTLVTCNNSFATKTSRYIVTAEFVEAFSTSN